MDTSTSHSALPGPTAVGPDTADTPDAPGGPPPARPDHLHRPREGRMVAGVAAGMADCFDLDPTVVRIGFVALCLLGGIAVPLYLAGWLLMPDEEADLSVGEELLAQARAS
ncbi:MAG TPA: PspC domain-containing protein [Acidimicrobiales bacterium]|nr:PspC domain-containing protein [Acidimicrobiales bacterium]